MLVANDLAPAGARRAALTPAATDAAAVVSVQNLVKRFGPHTVLDGVSLEIDRGQMVAIVGRSGSGKSTLLRCINALESIQGGTLRVCGHALGASDKGVLRELRRDVGIVFQSYNLFPHLTVERNITLALTAVKKMAKAQAVEICLLYTSDAADE